MSFINLNKKVKQLPLHLTLNFMKCNLNTMHRKKILEIYLEVSVYSKARRDCCGKKVTNEIEFIISGILVELEQTPEAYSEPSQITKMGRFAGKGIPS